MGCVWGGGGGGGGGGYVLEYYRGYRGGMGRMKCV